MIAIGYLICAIVAFVFARLEAVSLLYIPLGLMFLGCAIWQSIPYLFR